MEEITEISLAVERVLDEIITREEIYVTTAAYSNILQMEISLQEEYCYRLPDSDDLLKSLIYPETTTHSAMGVVSCSRHIAHMYMMAVSMMIDENKKCFPLLHFLRLLVAAEYLSPLLTIRNEGGAWFLAGSAELERLHHVRISARIPDPV
ncbi:hypothetical protein [Mesorhizobium sophorae]|uniref:hypothetical protein n=1 Tax=Mesorhizobium sophorae TaxID=1300294 RepID=UPI00117C12F6|nr:hypothetical protein [Mesorhizobium sophorae]